ncbi:small EDRK-rich factor 1 isoform X1 [Calonectris borealis]|uniref:small EDRK-rich factor 1 isoform X1 n=1 Tax=Calonectris borealis TaxID=1323832 RepID=UPI003F4C2245
MPNFKPRREVPAVGSPGGGLGREQHTGALGVRSPSRAAPLPRLQASTGGRTDRPARRCPREPPCTPRPRGGRREGGKDKAGGALAPQRPPPATPSQPRGGSALMEVVYGLPRAAVTLRAGGNQRELARQKNLKKTQEIHKGKRKEDSLSASQRKQRDSEIMQQKQKAANERKSLQAGAK